MLTVLKRIINFDRNLKFYKLEQLPIHGDDARTLCCHSSHFPTPFSLTSPSKSNPTFTLFNLFHVLSHCTLMSKNTIPPWHNAAPAQTLHCHLDFLEEVGIEHRFRFPQASEHSLSLPSMCSNSP